MSESDDDSWTETCGSTVTTPTRGGSSTGTTRGGSTGTTTGTTTAGTTAGTTASAGESAEEEELDSDEISKSAEYTSSSSESLSQTRPQPQAAAEPPGRCSCCRRTTQSREWYDISLHDRAATASHGYAKNFIRTAKYTIITFLPLNLFEQFRRLSNLYFLLSCIISFIPNISPFSPVTTLVPLVFVLVVTLIKDAIEDLQRHRADRKANATEYDVSRFADGQWTTETIRSADIVVGDVVHVFKEQEFPCDMVLLASSGVEGVCYIETANLDGETNLKRRTTPESLTNVTDADALHERFASNDCNITCEPPTIALYKFTGNLTEEGERALPLNSDNLLLRGSRLRNTKAVLGCCVYAGSDSKMMRNLRTVTSKFSRAQRRLNVIVGGIFVVNVIIIFIAAGLSANFQGNYSQNYPYLSVTSHSTAYAFGTSLATYFVAFTYLIPISLFVTVEIVRLGQALFMGWDRNMASDPDNIKETGMTARNSNMNEELGTIEHIFSDKTGTLTRNVMVLALWSIAGELSDHREDNECLLKRRDGNSDDPVTRFLRCIALCNSVVPDRDADAEDGAIKYDAESPDEAALVQATAASGVVLTAREASTLRIEINGEDEAYKVLATLGFSSDRKRMSVIVRYPDDTLWLICKGADSKILERLRDDDEIRDTTMDHLGDAAKEGLRTLLVGVRQLSDEEFEEWFDEFREAQTAVENREEKVEEVEEKIEVNLELLGATAVEDKLQDAVPETLQYLLKAGLHIWVLTGDKMETAETIGYSSSLLREGVDLMRLSAETAEELAAVIEEKTKHVNSETPSGEDVDTGKYAVIIDGHALAFALEDAVADEFLELCEMCQAVICCRVTPLQKAQVVLLVKKKTGRVCLAVGDGANDVSMIQAAHVGIGIVGKEGTQAVRASDYSLHEFRFLAPLITVQGRWSLVRLGVLVQYSFYKNLAFILPLFLFGFYSAWSGQIVYEQVVLTTFNILWASLPPLVIGIWEKDLQFDTLMSVPKLYSAFQKQNIFSIKTSLFWIANAIVHGIVIFFVVFIGAVSVETIYGDGKTAGFYVTATIASTAGVFTVVLKAALTMKWWTPCHFVAIFLSLGAYLIFVAVYFSLDLSATSYVYSTLVALYNTPVYYLTVALVIIMCLLPDFIVQYVRQYYFMEPWAKVRILEHQRRKEGKPARFKLDEDDNVVELEEYEPAVTSESFSDTA